MQNLCNSLSIINNNIRDNPDAFIFESEKFYHDQLKKVIELIKDRSGREIIMLAGPSSSGKTTTADKLLSALTNGGRQGYVISLDDFYLNAGEGPRKEDGSFDFESVHALDLPLIHSSIEQLLSGKETKLPLFDFTVGKRIDKTRSVTLREHDFVIIEGLHALNPLITSSFSSANLIKLYISVNSDIYDGDDVLLSRIELRFLRRLVRDYKYRNSSADNTFMLWTGVVEGETKYLLPHRENADIRLNSFHPYEVCVLKDMAAPLLQSAVKEEYKKEAVRLLKSISKFDTCPCGKVPADSLLREFIGPMEECKF